MHTTLDKNDIDYLKSLCKKNKKNKNIKFLELLLKKGLSSNLTEDDFINHGLTFKHKSNYRTRLAKFFKKDKKGFSVKKVTYEIRRDKNTFSNFLVEIKNFINTHKGISRNKIKKIKIYDEYRAKDKKVLLESIYSYFETEKIFNHLDASLVIKSIAENISTKNFLIKIENLVLNSETYIIKPTARSIGSNIVFVIIELEEKSYLYYYDSELPYNVESIEIDENKINLDIYGTILNKFNRELNYEKFNASQDYKNLVSNLVQWFDNIVHNEEKYENNFNIHKVDIKRNLEKLRLYFPENKFAYEYMNLYQMFLEQAYSNSTDDKSIIKEFLKKDIQQNFFKLIEKEMHKV